jgi:predicted Zn-dependent peptidase
MAMLTTTLLVAALLAPADTVSAQAPEPVRTTPGRVIVHRQPAVPLAALRVSILADDPPGYAGAGHLVQHIQFNALRERVARVGGRVQIVRNPDAFVYSVVGPANELPYLAEALSSALATPPITVATFLSANRILSEERMAEWETAEGHLRSQLRLQVKPEDRPAPGTGASAARLDAETVAAAWAQIYAPERVSVVAAGDMRVGTVEQAFSALPPTVRGQGLEPEPEPVEPLAAPEATRAWLGVGYGATGLQPHVLTVTAQLLTGTLRDRVGDGSSAVEHWWSGRGQALALIASVPGPRQAAARRALDGALASLQETVTSGDVERAAQRVRREMLFRSRTPEGMAEMVGAFADRTGEGNAAQLFYDALATVTLDQVQDALEDLLDRTPGRVEIPPQRLPER